MVSDLTGYLRGLVGYFGFCETPWELRNLDGWIRRRLRAVAWKHWKHGSTRCRELMRRGISRADAVHAAWRYKNPWRASRTVALNRALPDALWDRLGLLRLSTP
jgi:RNA-directed DNA polymerase